MKLQLSSTITEPNRRGGAKRVVQTHGEGRRSVGGVKRAILTEAALGYTRVPILNPKEYNCQSKCYI